MEHLQYLGELASKPAATYLDTKKAAAAAKEDDNIIQANFIRWGALKSTSR